MKKFSAAVLVLLVIAGSIVVYNKFFAHSKESVPVPVAIADVIRADEETAAEEADNAAPEILGTESPQPEIAIPDELNLAAPFYAQAPFGDWSYPWQEACEEASVLLVANAYKNTQWTRDQFKQEILNLVDWEIKNFGAYEHTDVKQTAKILTDYLGLKIIIHENPTFDDIKRILARGHLIVMTFAGKKLGNPFFTNGGPVYHAMVAKGYKEGDKLIFHDVGTRRGEDYVYKWSVISNALHDYAEPIDIGAKRIIEVLPPENHPPDNV